jgi:FKBP-type peptidyl-prolyl cis-trans isomerase SlyD
MPSQGSMRIEDGAVVRLAYELRNAAGEALEDPDAELEYLHGGYDGIFPKVEEALEGKEVGAEVDITLEPEDAFGEYDAELVRVEPRARFPESIEVGMQFEGVPDDDEQESLIYRVTDIAADKVVLDGNHQLAGERLWFKCRVVEVRKATAEEMEHGHVHGDTGIHSH